MLKLLGAMLVMSSCFLFALKVVTHQRENLLALHELEKLLTELARSITFRLEPLPQLLKRLAKDEHPPAPAFLKEIEIAIGDDIHRPLSEVWQQAFSTFSKQKKLPDQAIKLMNALGDGLGQMDVETENERLQHAATELNNLYTELEQGAKKTEKLTESLGVLFGMSIVILLL